MKKVYMVDLKSNSKHTNKLSKLKKLFNTVNYGDLIWVITMKGVTLTPFLNSQKPTKLFRK